MTTDQMQAGREMDALVAEKVMGWYPHGEGELPPQGIYPRFVVWNHGKSLTVYDSLNKHRPFWHPSEDITAAWQVWHHLTRVEPNSWAMYSDEDGEVSIEYYPESYSGSREEGSGYEWGRASLPLAICQAALRWSEKS